MASGGRLQISDFGPQAESDGSDGSVRSVRSMACRALLLLAICLAVPAFADFDAQRETMKGTMTTQPETAVVALLRAGIAEGKTAPAMAEVRKWLAQNRPENNMFLYYAGRAAELSGNWKDAVSLYRQFLTEADLASDEADEAVWAVYILMTERLKDENAAYDFGKNEGHRLVVIPRARQFDQWFLREARRRNDWVAVVKRLRACEKADYPEALIETHYADHYRWLIAQLDERLSRAPKVSDTLLETCKGLVNAITFSEEIKLRFDWQASVLYYHQAKLRGEDVEPPLAEARALLTAYPQYAAHVQTDWLGGLRDLHENNVEELNKYWPHEVDAKMEVVIAAIGRMTDLQKANFYRSWRPGYYNERQRFEPRLWQVTAIRSYLDANPDLMNERRGPFLLEKSWEKLSIDEAKALLPRVAGNMHPDVSGIAAIVAGGKDYETIMKAVTTSEIWRFHSERDISGYADRLWHYCGRPGGNEKRDEWKNKAKAAFKEGTAGDPGPEAGAKARMNAFKALWSDFRSSNPKEPNVYSRAKRVLSFSPELVPALLKTQDPDTQLLLRDVLADGMRDAKGDLERDGRAKGLNPYLYDSWFSRLAESKTRGNLDEFKKRYPELYKPHAFDAVFGKTIAAGLKQNRLVPWQVMVWLNLQHPDDKEPDIELLKAMQASAQWSEMPFETNYGIREWFGAAAMSAEQKAFLKAGKSDLVQADIQALSESSTVADTVNALNALMKKLRQSPVFIDDVSIYKLDKLPSNVLLDPAVMDKITELVSQFCVKTDHTEPGRQLLDYLRDNPDPVAVQRVAVYLFDAAACRHGRGQLLRPLVEFGETLVDSQPAVVAALARTGIQVFKKAGNVYGFSPSKHLDPLKALDVKASTRIGLLAIPVPKSDPAYPVYASQMEWMSGNADSAWQLCLENWEAFLQNHRKLSVDYTMWVLQRTIYSRDDAKQEALIKVLQAWAGGKDTSLSKKRQVEIELAYGDIAVQKGMLKQARTIYKQTEEKKAYDGLLIQYEATLRKARVERLAKNFDGALNTLNELALERVPELWSRIHYAMAEVYYDMEEYIDADDQVSSILAREPEHADAKIMQGRLQLKRKKLMEATEVELGTISSQQTLVPGEKLKVTLTDPTLAISGAGTEIEVAVWATSGDRELLFLRQFGDQKTKFRGEVQTALGKPAADDGVLQVIGDDKVFYAYSERFRKKMNDMEAKQGGPITIASDALLMASGRRLLTEAEQRVADMRAQMDAMKGNAGAAKASMAADAESRMMQGETVGGERTRTEIQSRLKPGNPIHVRVIDHDRSRTAAVDELAVSASTSSGDSIGRFVLKETGTHTGWFEGQIPTAGAQAKAYGASSEPGRNPNMVISPIADYPPWQPVDRKGVIPDFRVDLNDNAPLGKMTIVASEPGARLRSFLLQTGMNDKQWTTVAHYPKNEKNKLVAHDPWAPSVFVALAPGRQAHYGTPSIFEGYRDYQEHLSTGWLREASQHEFGNAVATNVTGASMALPAYVEEAISWKRSNRWPNPGVVARFQAYFYEPQDVTRRFLLDVGKRPNKVGDDHKDYKVEFMLVIDGRVINEQGQPVMGEIDLQAGVHRLEIWTSGWTDSIGFGRPVTLSANLENPDTLVEVPDRFFDPKTFPVGVLNHRNYPAEITAIADGTQFEVDFAEDSKARLLRLVFVEQEGTVPVLNKLRLQQPDGENVLPVKQDYAELNKNETLEILTGDNVAVRYVDDRYVSKAKETHERFLDVAFSNGNLWFQFFEMRRGRDEEMEPYYEQQLRFTHGQPVYLTVFDPDMDVSADLDTVSVSVQVEGGNAKTFTATEDELEPGTFRVQMTPVAGPAKAAHEIAVPEGGQLTAVYRDAENTNPGVATDRYAKIKHATFTAPILRLSDAVVKAIDFESLAYPLKPRPLNPGFEKMDSRAVETEEESLGLARPETTDAPVSGTVMPQWRIVNSLHDADKPPAGGFNAVHGQIMYIELEAPHLALRAGSTVNIYAQTQAGRSAIENTGGDVGRKAFDVSVPGTIKLQGELTQKTGHGNVWRATPKIPIYIGGDSPSKNMKYLKPEERVFVCSLPLIAGILPKNGVLNLSRKERHDLGIPKKHGLVVRPDEKIYVGMRYEDEAGTEQWITGQAKVITHPVFDIMADGYRSNLKAAYVGENLYLRVVDLGGDVTDGSDTVDVKMQAKSGAKLSVELLEVDNHSGIFKATLPLTYAGRDGVSEDYDVLREGFPVVYGDLVDAVYVDSKEQKTPIKRIKIRKGADGSITPFSKQYEDQEMAMRTQFALAEAYLEMAKNHRKRGEEKEALREYDQARRLLAGVIDQFTDPDTRSHAEFLLGNLTQEEADATDPGELQQKRYRAALARFMRVTGSYPDTQHASMAQFKIATVYEKLGEPDIAAQEYVKLAYKYPQSEFLALAMARLGTHFLRKASSYEKQAKTLLAATENKDARFEGQAMQKMAVREYLNAGSIFSRMIERFPSHELAGKCGLRAGQAYMRAESMRQALNTFLQVVDTESYDGPEIRAQAMYWAGMSYETMREPMAAYAIYKRLTYDFPESKWAAFARGQLSKERMLKLETDLEIERLEEEGQ